MKTLTILMGITDGKGNALPAQLIKPDDVDPLEALQALRQVEGQVIGMALMAAEQQGREAAEADQDKQDEQGEAITEETE